MPKTACRSSSSWRSRSRPITPARSRSGRRCQRSYNQEPYQIRRMLTESTVRASDKRALFVGLDAYEQAGGIVMRDLFEQDDGGWLEDVGLLDGLVDREAEGRGRDDRRRGLEVDRGRLSISRTATPIGLRELDGTPTDLTAEEQATIDALQRRVRPSSKPNMRTPTNCPTRSTHASAKSRRRSPPSRIGRSATIPPRSPAPASSSASIPMAASRRSGLCPARGRGAGRSGDRAGADAEAISDDGAEPPPPAVQRAVITHRRPDPEPEDEEDDAIKPLPDRLVTELTAHRTLALRDAVANNPHVAMTALAAQALPRHSSSTAASGGCLRCRSAHVSFPIQAPDLKDSPSAKAIAERHEAWKADAAEGRGRALGLARRPRRRQPQRAARPLRLVRRQRALREGRPLWRPASRSTASSAASTRPTGSRAPSGSTWSRPAGGRRSTTISAASPSPRILEAVREAKGEQSAQLIDHLKKADMAKEAERLLDGTGWLPEPLRTSERGHGARSCGPRRRSAARIPRRRRRGHSAADGVDSRSARRRRRIAHCQRGGCGRPAHGPRPEAATGRCTRSRALAAPETTRQRERRAGTG